jgi:PAS domain S-box-containing protein
MRFREIKELVDSTADPAFAIDGLGLIVAWNRAAEAMFGLAAQQAIGRPCSEILQGADECGAVCSPDCTVQQAVRKHHPISNFDLQVQTKQGPQWCNISVLIAGDAGSAWPYAIYIIRPNDIRKRLEMLMRDFIVTQTGLPTEQVTKVASVTRAPARGAELTTREVEILRLLAKGATTKGIAAELHISRATVNNHIQHILQKLNAHNRLEAIRRAERAGLI